MGRLSVCLFAALVAATAAAPRIPRFPASAQMLVQDQPIAPPTGQPEPDADGIVTAEVVNVNRKGVVLVQSTNDAFGVLRRAVIRKTWLQALNRTSEHALPTHIRRSYVVWFVVPRAATPAGDVLLETEGAKYGDIVTTKQVTDTADDMDNFISVCRWLRVAYFERHSFAAFLQDDGLVNLPNLDSYLDTVGDWFYGGHVSSFTKNPEKTNGNEFFVPYVTKGTMIVSRNFVEVISRDAGYIRHIGSTYDIGIGALLQPFVNGQPTSIPGCVADITTLYTPIETPIIINGIDGDMMAALMTPPYRLPAQAVMMETFNFHIDPHPKGDTEPLCNGMDDTGACRIAAKLLTDPEQA